jgi:large subunit ribosomal protein L13
MLPYKRERGMAAFKRIKTYVGVPMELVGIETETLEVAHIDRLSSPKYITIGAISTNLGAKY